MISNVPRRESVEQRFGSASIHTPHFGGVLMDHFTDFFMDFGWFWKDFDKLYGKFLWTNQRTILKAANQSALTARLRRCFLRVTFRTFAHRFVFQNFTNSDAAFLPGTRRTYKTASHDLIECEHQKYVKSHSLVGTSLIGGASLFGSLANHIGASLTGASLVGAPLVGESLAHHQSRISHCHNLSTVCAHHSLANHSDD